jgi:hypothetical protein
MANHTGTKNERFESLSAVKRLSDVRRLSDIKGSKQNADLFPRKSQPVAIPEAVAVRYRERARTLPELRVTASLTPDLLAQVEKRTRGTEVTRSSIVRAALHQYFQKESGSADMKTAKGAISSEAKSKCSSRRTSLSPRSRRHSPTIHYAITTYRHRHSASKIPSI